MALLGRFVQGGAGFREQVITAPHEAVIRRSITSHGGVSNSRV